MISHGLIDMSSVSVGWIGGWVTLNDFGLDGLDAVVLHVVSHSPSGYPGLILKTETEARGTSPLKV